MTENTKVNIDDIGEYYTEDQKRLLDTMWGKYWDKYNISPRNKWLDKVCPIINQNDFDTCRGGYSNDVLDSLQGYRPRYNTYLDQFENC